MNRHGGLGKDLHLGDLLSPGPTEVVEPGAVAPRMPGGLDGHPSSHVLDIPDDPDCDLAVAPDLPRRGVDLDDLASGETVGGRV